MTSHKPKTWKAWGVFYRGDCLLVRFDRGAAHLHAANLFEKTTIRPVTITLAKPRRKKK